MTILSTGSRDESVVLDLKAAKSEAENLQKYFSKKVVDENPIIDLLSSKSYAQIKLINQEYRKLTRSFLEKTVKKNFRDNLKDALIVILRTANSRSYSYARRINRAVNNYRFENRSLGRIIVARSEIDMMDIKEDFNRIYRKPLKSSFKNEISGSYRYALLTLLGEN